VADDRHQVGRAALIAAAAASLLAASQAAAQGTPGSAGLGDPYFPRSGNGGYDVGHYGLTLDYMPVSERLRASTRIIAMSTHDLSQFNLDFRGPRVSSLTVDGQPAPFRRQGQELIVTPPAPIGAGVQFEVVVIYAGKVGPVRDPDGSLEGWFPTGDGAFVAGEPRGSPTWFPCNDTPTDKATYRISITVPNGRKAFANGVLVDRTRGKRRTTFVWQEDEPMATYLATATNGRFRLETSTVNGIPSYVAVDPREARESRRALRKLPEILEVLSSQFGPYPFSSTGAIVDKARFVGFALETQTMPVYDSAPDDVLITHELAHQWFGDSVTPDRWREIWLNEGFATWAEWLWIAHQGGPSIQRTFKLLYRTRASQGRFWNPPPGDPGGPKHLFDGTIYVRGGMTLEALHQRVGDAVFSSILRRWAAEHRYGNASTVEFIALAEEESGQELEAFFADWLFERGKPASP
jgi:aminopeptidase N